MVAVTAKLAAWKLLCTYWGLCTWWCCSWRRCRGSHMPPSAQEWKRRQGSGLSPTCSNPAIFSSARAHTHTHTHTHTHKWRNGQNGRHSHANMGEKTRRHYWCCFTHTAGRQRERERKRECKKRERCLRRRRGREGWRVSRDESKIQRRQRKGKERERKREEEERRVESKVWWKQKLTASLPLLSLSPCSLSNKTLTSAFSHESFNSNTTGCMETTRPGTQAPLDSSPELLSLSCLLGFALMPTHMNARIHYAMTTIKQLFAICKCITEGLRWGESDLRLPERFWKAHINKSSPWMLSRIVCWRTVADRMMTNRFTTR